MRRRSRSSAGGSSWPRTVRPAHRLVVGDREVARGQVAGRVAGPRHQRRLLGRADLLRLPAPGAEPAAGRRVDRAGHVAGEQDPLALGAVAPRAGRAPAPPTSAPRCTGAAGCAYSSSRSAISTILPRYMTATRSEMCRTTDRSCAMNTYVRPSSSCRSSSRLTTCAWIDTSSAETGSSATISFGLQRERAGDADALALAAGELVRVAVVVLRVEADQLQQVLHRALDAVLGLDVLDPERRADDRADGVPRVQRRVRVLEDHLHVAAQRAQLALPTGA